MTISELKKQLEDSTFCSEKLIIFKSPHNNFVADSYTNAIARIKNLTIEYVDNINELTSSSESDIFGFADKANTIKVLKCETLDCENINLSQSINTIIITPSVTKSTENLFKSYIIEIPKLLDWQIKDLVYSKLNGIDKSKLDWLQAACKNDIYKIANEIDKLYNFSPAERPIIFEKMIEDGMYSDISNANIFNFTTALINQDKETVCKLYKEKDVLDISDMALLSIINQNIRNLILVHLNPNPTPENTGLSDKQIYAIKRTPLKLGRAQLYEVFEKITAIDSKIKSGEFPMEILFDYIIINVMGEFYN